MKRILSLFLALCICVLAFPAPAFAAERGELAEQSPIDSGKQDAKQETSVSATGATPAEQTVLTSLTGNTAVSTFAASRVKEATVSHVTNASSNLSSVVTALQASTSDNTAKTNLGKVSQDDLTCYVQVTGTTATVSSGKVQSMSFEVKPMAVATVVSSGGSVSVTAEIPNSAISSPISFRLPVSSSVAEGTVAKVKHGDTELGLYSVQASGTDRYIELQSTTFSTFSYELQQQELSTSGMKVTQSIVLRDSTDINFYINEIPAGKTIGNYKLKYSFAGGTATERSLADYTLKTPIKVASCTSTQYTQIASVDLYDTSGGTDVLVRHYDLSIEKYCTGIIDSETVTDSNLKALCASVLEYGYYAQEYFKSGGTSPSADHRSNLVPGTTIPAFSYQSKTTGTPSAIQKISISLQLKSFTELNYYVFLSDTSDSIDNYTISVSLDGTTYTPVTLDTPANLTIDKSSYTVTCPVTLTATSTAGKYQVKIAGIPFALLDQPFYLQTTETSGTRMVCYSPMAYTYCFQKTSGGNLYKALYNFYYSANRYFG